MSACGSAADDPRSSEVVVGKDRVERRVAQMIPDNLAAKVAEVGGDRHPDA